MSSAAAKLLMTLWWKKSEQGLVKTVSSNFDTSQKLCTNWYLLTIRILIETSMRRIERNILCKRKNFDCDLGRGSQNRGHKKNCEYQDESTYKARGKSKMSESLDRDWVIKVSSGSSSTFMMVSIDNVVERIKTVFTQKHDLEKWWKTK